MITQRQTAMLKRGRFFEAYGREYIAAGTPYDAGGGVGMVVRAFMWNAKKRRFIRLRDIQRIQHRVMPGGPP